MGETLAAAAGWSVLVDRARRLVEPRTRRLLGIAGAPGSGKSTLAARLVAALRPDAALVGMDGFHLAQAELVRLGRESRKGAPDTFDAAGYVALLRRLRHPGPDTVYAPRFDRAIEEAVAGAVPVTPGTPLVVTEGNYLLCDGGWSAVADLLDETWFLAPPERLRRERLVRRHRRQGRSLGQARTWAYGSDERNAGLVAGTRGRANLVITEVPCD